MKILRAEFNFRRERNMNFSKAVRGQMSLDRILRDVDSQSETELGRHLDPSEKNLLFSRFPPEIVGSRIDQVCNTFLIGFPLKLIHSSMGMVH